MKLYIDVESAGLKGPLHMIQYSVDRGPVHILRCPQVSPHLRGIRDQFIELMWHLENSETVIIGFNLGFDLWKLYTHFRPDHAWPCQVLDLYQHTLKAKPLCYYPLTTGKQVVQIKKIPRKYSAGVEKKITEEIKSILPPIAETTVSRSVEGDFVSLEFGVKVPAKLKKLAELFLSEKERGEILNFTEVLKVPDWREDERFPYVTFEEREKYEKLWLENESIFDGPAGHRAIEYARKDVEYLWKLEDWLVSEGNEIEIDSDDVCTHIVAYTKYFGFPVDVKKAKSLRTKFKKEMKALQAELGIDLESPKQRLELLRENALIPEAIISTGKDNLDILLAEKDAGLLTDEGLEIAQKMSRYKPLAQRRKMLETVTEGDGRVYPDFVVLGTSTHRMRGRGGINFQGIAREGEIREIFLTSMGGDFDGLEWCLAANVYNDIEMLKGLREGIDPHTLAAALLITPPCDYEKRMHIKKDKNHLRHGAILEERAKGKKVNFAVLYQAGPHKIAQTLDCIPEEAQEKMENCFFGHYRSLGETRSALEMAFCTADFEKWDQASVGKMDDHVVGVFGDIRWVCFEKHMASFFWEKADEFAQLAGGDETRVLRQQAKGKQFIGQAIRSAVLGAASGIQKVVMRQLGNFRIQNAGARLTKMLMARIWEKHYLPMMNVHDEIDVPGDDHCDYEAVKNTVDEFIEEYREKFTGLSMGWKKTKTWADK